MALKPETKSVFLLSVLASVVVFGGFGALIWAGQERNQVAWDTPMYHRDPRAPKVCMCHWMRSAFYVPCSEVPEELLKEVK
jgi:hypothetical protein